MQLARERARRAEELEQSIIDAQIRRGERAPTNSSQVEAPTRPCGPKATISYVSFAEEAWTDKTSEEAQEIEPDLFLGPVSVATDIKALEQLKITHILVAQPGLAMTWPSRFTYKILVLENSPSSNLLEHLPEAIPFLSESKLQGGRILVACSRGISAGPSIIVALLMTTRGLKYDVAKQRVEKKRPVVFPNLGFQAQLEHFEVLLENVKGHLGSKLNWLRSPGTVPLGDLCAADSSFAVREAMVRPVRFHLRQLRKLLDKVPCDETILHDRSVWRSQARFFEALREHKAIPKDRTLLTSVSSLAKELKALLTTLSSLAKEMREMSPDTNIESPEAAPGMQAALALVHDLEAWLAFAAPVLQSDEPASSGDNAGSIVDDGDVVVMSDSKAKKRSKAKQAKPAAKKPRIETEASTLV